MEMIQTPAPAELTDLIRADMAAYEEERAGLAQFLPNTHINSTVARSSDLIEEDGEAAELRAFDAEAPIGKAAEKTVNVVFDLPAISQKLRVTEMDQLREISDDKQSDVIARRSLQTGRAVADRVELLRGEVLVTGKIDVQGENGVHANVDFGRNPLMEVESSENFEDPAAKALTDLEGWLESYTDLNGFAPSTMLLSGKSLRYLVKNKEVIGAVTDTPSKTRVNQQMVRDLLGEFGITDIVTYDRRIRFNGQRDRVIPEDKILLLPNPADGSIGQSVFGTTVEAWNPAYGYNIHPDDAPGIVSGAWQTQDPAGVWTRGNAIASPVLVRPDLAMVATISG